MFLNNIKRLVYVLKVHVYFPFNSLLQWFQSAPSKTCPQCRKQVNLWLDL